MNLFKQGYISSVKGYIFEQVNKLSQVILGQNCIQLLDGACNDLYSTKNCFIKRSVIMQ